MSVVGPRPVEAAVIEQAEGLRAMCASIAVTLDADPFRRPLGQRNVCVTALRTLQVTGRLIDHMHLVREFKGRDQSLNRAKDRDGYVAEQPTRSEVKRGHDRL